jgi:hypothetical protein
MNPEFFENKVARTDDLENSLGGQTPSVEARAVMVFFDYVPAMKRSFVLAAAATAAVWLMAGCERTEQAPPPRVHHKAAIEAKAKPEKSPRQILPGTAEYLDLKNGFRDVVFGTPQASFTDLVLKEKDDATGTATYTRSGDLLNSDGVPLQEIDYTFFKDQLSAVTVKWKLEFPTNDFSAPASSGLAAGCTQLYGRPKQLQTQRDMTHYIWSGQKVRIRLDEMKMSGVANTSGGGWAIPPVTSGEMVIESIPLIQELNIYVSSQTANKTSL